MPLLNGTYTMVPSGLTTRKKARGRKREIANELSGRKRKHLETAILIGHIERRAIRRDGHSDWARLCRYEGRDQTRGGVDDGDGGICLICDIHFLPAGTSRKTKDNADAGCSHQYDVDDGAAGIGKNLAWISGWCSEPDSHND